MLSYDCSVETRSFYIHWPFCPYKCHFCPFVAIAAHDEYMLDYHKALNLELDYFFSQQLKKIKIDTIYLGGGTPSTYPTDLLLDTFDKLRECSIFSPEVEITLEVNPGTVTQEKIIAWKNLGVTRLSLGVQSLNNQVLNDLNRLQSKEDVYNFLSMASPYFENISIDLIIGLPGVSEQEWKQLVETVVLWPIKHISTYFLTVHENTPLFFRVKKKNIKLPNEDKVVDLYLWTIDYLAKHGFEHYETSSFAKAGYESRHNQVYWSYKPYKAFGMGACSFDGYKRSQNEKNLMEYLSKTKINADLSISTELLTAEQMKLEKIMLGLRCLKQGVQVSDILTGLDDKRQREIVDYIAAVCDKGFLKKAHDRIFLTPAGVILENEIVVNLSK